MMNLREAAKKLELKDRFDIVFEAQSRCIEIAEQV
jgi:hypothetical protein